MARKATGNPVGRPPSEATLLAREIEKIAKTLREPKIQARYDAAGRGRRMAGWNAPSTGPNLALAGLQTIRDRARDSSRNDWSGESAVQKWTTNLVGIGITPRWKRIKSKTRRQEITDLWNDFVQQSDADCVLNLYGMQSLGVRSWLDGGEFFARKRSRYLDEGLPVPMQVQLMEADMCPMLDAETYVGLPLNHVIRSGIEFNKRGRRTAYWFYKEHPGDGRAVFTANDLVRVAASEVAHVFRPLRPGQIRGVSLLAPILARLRNIENYDDATLERQKLANMFVGFIKRTLPTVGPNSDIDPLTGQELAAVEDTGAPLLGLQPGLIQELEDGQEIQLSNPPEAGTTYSDYMRTQHMGTAAASGLPYELFSGDLLNISDRTLRIAVNEMRRLAEQHQWQIVIPMFCQRVVEWFVDAAVLAGKITLEEVDDVRRVEHSPHGWPDIHPTQDIEGRIAAVNAGFRSRNSVTAAAGDDMDSVDEERQQDDRREQQLEIGPYSKAKVAEKAPKPVAAPAPAAPPPSALDAAAVALFTQQTASLREPPKPEPDPYLERALAALDQLMETPDGD